MAAGTADSPKKCNEPTPATTAVAVAVQKAKSICIAHGPGPAEQNQYGFFLFFFPFLFSSTIPAMVHCSIVAFCISIPKQRRANDDIYILYHSGENSTFLEVGCGQRKGSLWLRRGAVVAWSHHSTTVLASRPELSCSSLLELGGDGSEDIGGTDNLTGIPQGAGMYALMYGRKEGHTQYILVMFSRQSGITKFVIFLSVYHSLLQGFVEFTLA